MFHLHIHTVNIVTVTFNNRLYLLIAVTKGYFLKSSTKQCTVFFYRNKAKHQFYLPEIVCKQQDPIEDLQPIEHHNVIHHRQYGSGKQRLSADLLTYCYTIL